MEFSIKVKKERKRLEDEKRQEQIEIVDALNKMVKEHPSFSTIVELPTGGGKTKIAKDFCLNSLGVLNEGSGISSIPYKKQCNNDKVLWLADRLDLLTQTIDSFEDEDFKVKTSYQLICTSNISITNDAEGKKYWERSNKNHVNSYLEEIEKDTKILFASINTIRNYEPHDVRFSCLNSWLKSSQKGGGTLFIIYDEAHHIGTDANEGFLFNVFDNTIGGDGRYILIGLSATVYRYDSLACFKRWFKYGYDKEKKIVVNDSKSKIGEDEDGDINNRIKVIDIGDLIKDKRLAEATLIRVDDFEHGMPTDEMEYLAKKIADTYREKNWGKTIIFVNNVDDATKLRDNLKKRNVESFAYVSSKNKKQCKDENITDSDKKNKKEYEDKDIADFKESRDCKIMIAIDMVTEGFDVPDINTIYLYSKMQSHIQMRQKIGRVLRTTEEKKTATIYWQKYFECENKVEINEYIDKIEDQNDIDNEISEWQDGKLKQLPAGIYLNALPDIDKDRRIMIKAMLDIMELFESDEESVKYADKFLVGDDLLIPVGHREKRGYEQFYHMICADYRSCLRYNKEYKRFKDYADALICDRNVDKEKALLDDIKINCFYMANIEKDDVSGKVIEDKDKRFWVKDENIIAFYEWVVGNDFKMPPIINNDNEDTNDDLEENNEQNGKAPKKNEEISNLIEYKYTQIYMKKHPRKKKKGLLEAIVLQQEIKKEQKNDANFPNIPKEYSEIMKYGRNKIYTYQQLLSARAVIECGAAKEKREVGNLGGITGELALIGKNEEGKYHQIRSIKRMLKMLASGDDLFIAQTLITVPNHINISREDVSEYKNKLFGILEDKCKLTEDKKTKVTEEFLMALGYRREQEDIIRMQCELFDNKLPKLLQYVIYCHIYNKLVEEISYYKDNELVPECQNEDKLHNKYNEIISGLGNITLDKELDPVKDVIDDYRPYFKAVPYYLGMKPEYLCRMLNDILKISQDKITNFYDTFGGSGTISLNINPALNLKKHYNDMGIFNKAFFDVLRSHELCGNLTSKVEEFINIIVNHTGNDKVTKAFFEPYCTLLNIKESRLESKEKYIDDKKEKEDLIKKQQNINEIIKVLNEDIDETESNYIKDNVNSTNDTEEERRKEIDKRLKDDEIRYCKLLDLILADDAKEKCGKEKIRSIEKHFHVMLLRVCKIFMELKGDNCESLVSDIHIKEGDGEADCTKGMDDKTKVDLAFVFFAFNCINLRPFYNGANIVALAKIIGNYKASLLNASEIFKNIECDGKNALNLIDDFKDKRNSVWYHDIPYSQTKDSTYVVHGFNEVLFTERISECSGKYIVASRFNICESSLNNDFRNINHTKKQYGVIKFFSRFLPEKYFSKYNLTNIIDEDYKGYVCEKDKEMYGWKHVLEEKKAEYVIFAYCQLEQELNNKEGDAKEGEDAQKGKAGYFRRSSTVSVDSIRRMLKSTQLTDISVEIMITNMKLTLNPVCLVDDNSEIWCLPTFKTPSSYKVNPITIIMPYKLFYEQIILQLLSKEAYEKVFEENVKDTAKDTAAAFRKFYSNR